MSAVRAALVRLLGSPVAAALVVLAVYVGLAIPTLANRPAVDFAFVGSAFVEHDGMTPAIRQHVDATSRYGYDGQYALYIALDPRHAANTIDDPPYRYSHILYPALARTLAVGNNDWVPATLLIVNLLAVFFGTLALGLILRRQHRRPAFAVLFGLFGGAVVSFDRDLGDLLAYAFVGLGVLALHSKTPRRLALAGALFGAAALGRETTLIFPAVLAVAELAGSGQWPARARRAAALALPAVVPYAVWRLFMFAWLGPNGSAPDGFTFVPFGGVVPHGQLAPLTFLNVTTVVVPAVFLLIAVLGGLARRPSPYGAIVVLQVLLLVVFLPAQSYQNYFSAGRLQLGTVVAALCCLPTLMAAPLRYRQVLGVAVVLAMTPTVPFALALLSGKPI